SASRKSHRRLAMPFFASSRGWQARRTRSFVGGQTSAIYAINGIASEAISSARDRDGGRRNDRGGGHDCLHGDLASPAITKAARQVIVDQPDALHQGVDDRRADKSEPTPAKVGRQAVRFGRR